MNRPYYIVFAFAVGLALGAFFSLNLWSSVQRMTDDKTPWFILYGGFMLRISFVLLGFYLVMNGHWERMIAALCGFVLMREILVRALGKSPGVS
jgi:F1F0 ATPase subunit 2